MALFPRIRDAQLREIRGGVLGEHVTMFKEIRDALTAIEQKGYKIAVNPNGSSIRIDYAGPGETGWTGKVYSATGVLLTTVDITDPENIEGTHVNIDPATGDLVWSIGGKSDDEEHAGWACYEVAGELSEESQEAGLPQFTLNLATRGDIVLGGGGGIDVAGTPELFKVCALVGWEKADEESNWEIMSAADMVTHNPARMWHTFVDGVDSYPWRALRPTWDWVRAVDDEEEEEED